MGLKTTGSKAELEARYEASTGDGLHHSFGPSLYEGSGYKDHTLLRLLIRYILDYNWGYLRVIISPLGVVYKLIWCYLSVNWGLFVRLLGIFWGCTKLWLSPILQFEATYDFQQKRLPRIPNLARNWSKHNLINNSS